jgi:hypothetical protein
MQELGVAKYLQYDSSIRVYGVWNFCEVRQLGAMSNGRHFRRNGTHAMTRF